MARCALRASLAALLLHICIVSLFTAAPAITARTPLDAVASSDETELESDVAGRWLGTRALLQVRLLELSSQRSVRRFVKTISGTKCFGSARNAGSLGAWLPVVGTDMIAMDHQRLRQSGNCCSDGSLPSTSCRCQRISACNNLL